MALIIYSIVRDVSNKSIVYTNNHHNNNIISQVLKSASLSAFFRSAYINYYSNLLIFDVSI